MENCKPFVIFAESYVICFHHTEGAEGTNSDAKVVTRLSVQAASQSPLERGLFPPCKV